MRPTRAVLALAVTVGAVPGVARASSVSVDPSTDTAIFRSGSSASDVTTTFSVFPGEPFPIRLNVVDAAQTLTANEGCTVGVPIMCLAHNQDIRLGGGNDRFGGRSSAGSIAVTAGEGDDDVVADGLYTTVLGGRGADTLAVASNGQSIADGGDGDDHIRSFGANTTRLSGGAGDDLVVGRSSLNDVSGSAGDDDVIAVAQDGVMTGGAGEDQLVVVGSGSVYSGGGYTINGGIDDDVISAGPAVDSVLGGDGNDNIDVSGDGQADTVNCGAGYDAVYADETDILSMNCEVRMSGPMPAPGVERALDHLATVFPGVGV